MSATTSYARVPNEAVELEDVQLESSNIRDTVAPSDSSRRSSTDEGNQTNDERPRRRLAYSSQHIARRTPRLDGESDDDYNRRIRTQHISSLMHSIGWVAAAFAVIYFTDLLNVVRYDQRLNRSFLLMGFTSMGILLGVVGYLALWVPLRASRPILDLAQYAPRAVMGGAISGVATFVFFTIALWPIWSFITLPIMIILSFAACLGPNLLPFIS